jgi:hypothetical protein
LRDRSGKVSGAESSPLEQVQREMEGLHSEVSALQQELTAERAQGRSRHAHLVETLTAALQARDAALGALKRLEDFCQQRGLDVNGLAVYEVSHSIAPSECRFALVMLHYARVV